MLEQASVLQQLLELSDPSYRDFHAKLIPTVPKEHIIGIRTPVLRRFAAAFSKTPEADSFLRTLPHTYYEENNLHAFLIERITDYDRALAAADAFLPYIDNWATCDFFSPRAFKMNTDRLLEPIYAWLASNRTYTVRFGLDMLMRYYLDERFDPKYLELAVAVPTEDYYLHMAVAWFFATALTKQYERTLPYFLQNRLDRQTHNKALQKTRESLRVPKERKEYLNTLKRA